MVKEKSFYKTLLTIALPVALQQLISLGVVMLDNVMVGGLGDVALSAVAQANQVTVFFTYIVRGLSGGAALLISQYWGKRDTARIKQIFSVVFLVTAFLSASASVFVFTCPGAVMRFFANDEALIGEAVDYIRAVAVSYFLFAISDTLTGMLRCIELVKITFLASVFSLFSNLFFNYSLIYGHFGFPALGVVGAAYATVITRALELCIILVYFFCIQKRIKVRPVDLFRPGKTMFGDYCRYGLPILIGDAQWGLVGVFKAAIIGQLGVQMVSASSIADTVMQLGLIFANGLAAAACVVIGKTVGAGDYARTKEYSRTIEILFAAVGIVMSLGIFFTRSLPISLYSKITPETRALAYDLLGIGALTLMGTGYHMACFTGINRGAGDSRFVFIVDMICGWCVMLPLSLLAVFVFKWPLPVVFLCTRIDQCFKWVIAFIRLRGNKWIRRVVRDTPETSAAD